MMVQLLSVGFAFGSRPAEEVAPLHAVHLAACDLAKDALNWSLGALLTREHASALSGHR